MKKFIFEKYVNALNSFYYVSLSLRQVWVRLLSFDHVENLPYLLFMST